MFIMTLENAWDIMLSEKARYRSIYKASAQLWGKNPYLFRKKSERKYANIYYW